MSAEDRGTVVGVSSAEATSDAAFDFWQPKVHDTLALAEPAHPHTRYCCQYFTPRITLSWAESKYSEQVDLWSNPQTVSSPGESLVETGVQCLCYVTASLPAVSLEPVQLLYRSCTPYNHDNLRHNGITESVLEDGKLDWRAIKACNQIDLVNPKPHLEWCTVGLCSTYRYRSDVTATLNLSRQDNLQHEERS